MTVLLECFTVIIENLDIVIKYCFGLRIDTRGGNTMYTPCATSVLTSELLWLNTKPILILVWQSSVNGQGYKNACNGIRLNIATLFTVNSCQAKQYSLPLLH